jgi:hypothetical protein
VTELTRLGGMPEQAFHRALSGAEDGTPGERLDFADAYLAAAAELWGVVGSRLSTGSIGSHPSNAWSLSAASYGFRRDPRSDAPPPFPFSLGHSPARHASARTEDFVAVAEEVSGRDLSWFWVAFCGLQSSDTNSTQRKRSD